MTWYVYIDWIVVDGVEHIIYVGKGSAERCNHVQRNAKHQRLWKRYAGQRAVVAEFSSSDEACRCERGLIARYSTYYASMWADRYACNLTLGGEQGAFGYQHTASARAAISAALHHRRGVAHPLYGKPARNRGKPPSDATRERQRVVMRLKCRDPEHIARISAGVVRAMARPETKAKHTGVNHWSVRNPNAAQIIADTARKCGKVVQQLDEDGTVLAEFPSASDAARALRINRGNICTCARNQRGCAGGYEWRYV